MWVGGLVISRVLRALGATWRIQVQEADWLSRGEPVVAALWHRGLFAAAYTFRDHGFVVPVSLSRDGDRIAEVLRRLGFGPSPRGSSSRGAARLLAALIRSSREGQTLGILCDGPRGPAGRAKPGVVAVARAGGRPVVPVGIAASPSLAFGSWDRVILPLPFARVVFTFGPPRTVDRTTDRDRLEAVRDQLERDLDREQERAQALLDGGRAL